MNKDIKILLVDDVQAILTFAQTLLNRLGYGFVDSALDADDALAKVAESKHDVVFLDISLPSANGISLISEIHSLSPDSKVIMCSGHSTEDNVKSAISAGAEGFLVKPITPVNMCSVIDRVSSSVKTANNDLSKPEIPAVCGNVNPPVSSEAIA